MRRESINLKTELSWKVLLHKGHSQKPSSVLIGSMGPPSGPSTVVCFRFMISILFFVFPISFSGSPSKWLFKCIRIDLLDAVLKLQSAAEHRNTPSGDFDGVITQIWSFSTVDISVNVSNPDEVIEDVFCDPDDWLFEFASSIRIRSQTALPLMIYQFTKVKDIKPPTV